MKKNLFKRTIAIVFALTLMIGTLTISGFANEGTDDENDANATAQMDVDVTASVAPFVTVVSVEPLHNREYAKVGLKQYSSNNNTVEIAPGIILTTATGNGQWTLHFADGVSGQYKVYAHHGGNQASVFTIEAVGPAEWVIGDGGGHSKSINHIKFGAVGQPEQYPATPIVTVFKNTNMDGEFRFVVTLNGATEYVKIRTKSGTGYYDYELPDNFTGTMAVSESAWYNGSDLGLDGWVFDSAEYELVFDKGELVSPKDAELETSFNNCYEAVEEEEEPLCPEITVMKKSDAGEGGEVVVGQPVNYIVTVTNTGNEDIWNLAISDDRFGMVTGGVTVSVMQPEDSGFRALDEEQGDYRFEGAIVFAEDFVLKAGGIIEVEYAIAWAGEGSHTNTAMAEGKGIETREPVSGEGVATVVIAGGSDRKDGGKTMHRSTEGNTADSAYDGGMTIPSEDVPLAALPDAYPVPIEIAGSEVPLGDIPQTGSEDMALKFGLLGLSLSAFLVLLLTRIRKTN
ncbi:MAG: LPXTG cell wall anchor domain-containing protein [Clostridiales bacterium]|nr:LPXTG cell wall anchor domain-containing protein [Clostridiales bacterium]